MRRRSRIWTKQFLERDEMCSDKEWLESKMNPRLRADVMGLRMTSELICKEGWLIFLSWTGRPMSRNSVLVGLSERKFDFIHDVMLEMVSCKCWMLFAKLVPEKDM